MFLIVSMFGEEKMVVATSYKEQRMTLKYVKSTAYINEFEL
jgi:hypothetical protein